MSKTQKEPVEFNVHRFNGKYKNQINENQYYGLWNILAENQRFERDTTYVSQNSIVQLKLVDKQTLKADLIENDSIIKSTLFNGKIKNNFFSIKKKLLFIPIPALMLYRERKTIIGNDLTGNLILTKGTKNGGWILVIASDNGGITSYDFERIKN